MNLVLSTTDGNAVIVQETVDGKSCELRKRDTLAKAKATGASSTNMLL